MDENSVFVDDGAFLGTGKTVGANRLGDVGSSKVSKDSNLNFCGLCTSREMKNYEGAGHEQVCGQAGVFSRVKAHLPDLKIFRSLRSNLKLLLLIDSI